MNTSESGYAIFERHFQKYTPITLHYDFSQRDQINSLRNGRDPDLKQIENTFKDPEDPPFSEPPSFFFFFLSLKYRNNIWFLWLRWRMCISDDCFYQSIYSCILSPQTHCQKFTPKITTIHPPFQNPGSAPEIVLIFVGVSSKHLWVLLESLRQSSEIFGDLSEIFRKCLGTFVGPLEQFWKIFRKWSEIFGKSSKTPSAVCLYNKKNITR